jgi:hypothetical protein
MPLLYCFMMRLLWCIGWLLSLLVLIVIIMQAGISLFESARRHAESKHLPPCVAWHSCIDYIISSAGGQDQMMMIMWLHPLQSSQVNPPSLTWSCLQADEIWSAFRNISHHFVPRKDEKISHHIVLVDVSIV